MSIIVTKDGAIRSNRFDDIYFSKYSGYEESMYVYVERHNIERRINANKAFHICEFGFGTGLNFLCTLQKLLTIPEAENTLLHYHAIEIEPLSKEDILLALHKWHAKFGSIFDNFIDLYQPITQNIQLHNVILHLHVGNIKDKLHSMPEWVDIWYMDGFSPKVNPDMWSSEIFALMAKKSSINATFSTFTSAGFVRRGLIQAGFEVIKIQGYGQKRDMLIGNITNVHKFKTK